jgi:hypothetical protein
MVAAPSGATHFNINSAGLEIDFEQGVYVSDISGISNIDLNNETVDALTLTHTVTPNSTKPLFILLGIEFYQEVNGSRYPLKNGAYNALAIVKVSGV